jgi:arylsulfatase
VTIHVMIGSRQAGRHAAARGRIVGVLLALLCGCEKQAEPPWPAEPPPSGPTPNIVFVLIDTLRADHLGVCGCSEGHSPNLDAIAAEGVIFDRAVAQSPWTQPSVASLFCSRYPSVHKVLDYRQAVDGVVEGGEKVAVFDDKFSTLAESLWNRGYATAAFVANPFVTREFGFAQGFEHFDASFARNTTPGGVVNDAAVAWLRRRSGDRPFFVYLHYMDPHGPYEAAPEFLAPLLEQVERMPNKRILTDEEFENLDWLRMPPQVYKDLDRHRRLERFQEYWAARYAAGVRQADHYLGELRSRLMEMNLWNDTYVIITADHGEALCEHGFWDHGWSVYETDLHVPLVLRWPGVLPAGKRVSQTVQLIDVMPTLLEQLELPPPAGLQGASLAPWLAGEPPSAAAIAFAEGIKRGLEQKAVYAGSWKLIKTDVIDRVQLYNLVEDPGERNDLARRRPPPMKLLRGLLEQQVALNARAAGGFDAEHVRLTPEQRERLESLGYIGR